MNALFNTHPKALLALADGLVYEGFSCGAIGEAQGEVIVSITSAGYQQVLSDPANEGKVAVFTYPQIGNVGCNKADDLGGSGACALVVRDLIGQPSSFRAEQDLPSYLEVRGIVGIEGIDTRSLVAYLRDHSPQMAIVSTVDLDPAHLAARAAALEGGEE